MICNLTATPKKPRGWYRCDSDTGRMFIVAAPALSFSDTTTGKLN
jgi:hypothetical protein